MRCAVVNDANLIENLIEADPADDQVGDGFRLFAIGKIFAEIGQPWDPTKLVPDTPPLPPPPPPPQIIDGIENI